MALSDIPELKPKKKERAISHFALLLLWLLADNISSNSNHNIVTCHYLRCTLNSPSGMTAVRLVANDS